MDLVKKAIVVTHRAVYRATSGRMGGHYRDARILLLTTTGRRTGRRRVTPVVYVETDTGVAVIASNGGDDRHPAWYLNLRDHPVVDVQIGADTRTLRARDTDGPERDRLWAKAVAVYGPYEQYQRKTSRPIPVVALDPISDSTGQ